MSNAASLLGLARFQALANSIEVKQPEKFDENSIIFIDGEMVTIGDLVSLWQEVKRATKKIDKAIEKVDENLKKASTPKKTKQSGEQPKSGKNSESNSKKSRKLTRSQTDLLPKDATAITETLEQKTTKTSRTKPIS